MALPPPCFLRQHGCWLGRRHRKRAAGGEPSVLIAPHSIRHRTFTHKPDSAAQTRRPIPDTAWSGAEDVNRNVRSTTRPRSAFIGRLQNDQTLA